MKWREKRASGMRASSFLHTSFPTQRKETSEQSKTRAHLFPLVFALYTCPLLFFNWIKDQRKKGKGTHAFFFCLYSINEKQRGTKRRNGSEQSVHFIYLCSRSIGFFWVCSLCSFGSVHASTSLHYNRTKDNKGTNQGHSLWLRIFPVEISCALF